MERGPEVAAWSAARRWRVFGVLVAGALTAAVLASDQLASWADAHADRPGGAALAGALHRWDTLLAPVHGVRERLHGWAQEAVQRQF